MKGLKNQNECLLRELRDLREIELREEVMAVNSLDARLL